MNTKRFVRSIRGWIYRRFPCWNDSLYKKKRAGYERRWNLEYEGFTKEGFFRIFWNRFCSKNQGGGLLELVAGDGLVGSLGVWLESTESDWQVQAWEHRPLVLRQLRWNRPRTDIREGRLTKWPAVEVGMLYAAITTRGAREASGVCRGIRRGVLRPPWIGIWNPRCCAVWCQRLRREGYWLEMVWHQIEFYRPRRA